MDQRPLYREVLAISRAIAAAEDHEEILRLVVERTAAFTGPVLFMSGYTPDSTGHAGVLEEGIDSLAKPFTTSALLARVREALDRPLRPGLPGRAPA